jgi:hypothetical protein
VQWWKLVHIVCLDQAQLLARPALNAGYRREGDSLWAESTDEGQAGHEQ